MKTFFWWNSMWLKFLALFSFLVALVIFWRMELRLIVILQLLYFCHVTNSAWNALCFHYTVISNIDCIKEETTKLGNVMKKYHVAHLFMKFLLHDHANLQCLLIHVIEILSQNRKDCLLWDFLKWRLDAQQKRKDLTTC